MNQLHENQHTNYHLAHAHRQQANYHQQQAQFHHEQANAFARHTGNPVTPNMAGYTAPTSYTGGPTGFTNVPGGTWQGVQAWQTAIPSQWNNPRYTASNNQVSPAALVYHGQISPEAMRSVQEYQNPYNQQRGAQHFTSPMSHHAQHATDNATSVHRTVGQYFNT